MEYLIKSVYNKANNYGAHSCNYNLCLKHVHMCSQSGHYCYFTCYPLSTAENLIIDNRVKSTYFLSSGTWWQNFCIHLQGVGGVAFSVAACLTYTRRTSTLTRWFMEDFFDRTETEIPLSYIVYCLSRSLVTKLSRILNKQGIEITVEQYRTLFIIDRHSGKTQQWLSNTLLVDKSSLSRIVDTLTQKGLVEREKIRGGGNLYSVRATEHGKALVKQCHALSLELAKEACSSLSDPEKSQFRGTLVDLLAANGHPLPE